MAFPVRVLLSLERSGDMRLSRVHLLFGDYRSGIPGEMVGEGVGSVIELEVIE